MLLVHRGKCKFTAKARVAEAAGASAILIINSRRGMIVLLCACYGYESVQSIIYVTWNLLVQDLHTIQVAYMLSGHGGMRNFFSFSESSDQLN